jgi:hypothetical protein
LPRSRRQEYPVQTAITSVRQRARHHGEQFPGHQRAGLGDDGERPGHDHRAAGVIDDGFELPLRQQPGCDERQHHHAEQQHEGVGDTEGAGHRQWFRGGAAKGAMLIDRLPGGNSCCGIQPVVPCETQGC